MAEEKYTDKYDNIDLDEILSNKRLLMAYVNCVLDKGKCSPEGKELKGKMILSIFVTVNLKVVITWNLGTQFSSTMIWVRYIFHWQSGS